VRPDPHPDPLEAARSVLACLRAARPSECVVSVESVESLSPQEVSTLTTQPSAVRGDVDDEADGAGTPVNPGVLMTLAMRHGYPRLPLKPGLSVAEGERAWRTFTRSSGQDWLGLAAEAARAAWGDDPMVGDLLFVDRTGPWGDASDADVTTVAGADQDRDAARRGSWT
jgi:hypothetical protein